MTQPKETKNLKVLARLGHDRVVCGHHQYGKIDPRRTGEHVFDKSLMPGHVDDAEPKGRHIEDSEADIDGDAPRLFFGQTVAVDTGESLDQGRRAMIDVAGRAEDEVSCHG